MKFVFLFEPFGIIAGKFLLSMMLFLKINGFRAIKAGFYEKDPDLVMTWSQRYPVSSI